MVGEHLKLPMDFDPRQCSYFGRRLSESQYEKLWVSWREGVAKVTGLVSSPSKDVSSDVLAKVAKQFCPCVGDEFERRIKRCRQLSTHQPNASSSDSSAGGDMAILCLKDAELDEEFFLQLLEVLAKRPIIASLDLRGNVLTPRGIQVLLRLLRGQVNLTTSLDYDRKLRCSFLGEVLIDEALWRAAALEGIGGAGPEGLSPSLAILEEEAVIARKEAAEAAEAGSLWEPASLLKLREYTAMLTLENVKIFIREAFVRCRLAQPAVGGDLLSKAQGLMIWREMLSADHALASVLRTPQFNGASLSTKDDMLFLEQVAKTSAASGSSASMNYSEFEALVVQCLRVRQERIPILPLLPREEEGSLVSSGVSQTGVGGNRLNGVPRPTSPRGTYTTGIFPGMGLPPTGSSPRVSSFTLNNGSAGLTPSRTSSLLDIGNPSGVTPLRTVRSTDALLGSQTPTGDTANRSTGILRLQMPPPPDLKSILGTDSTTPHVIPPTPPALESVQVNDHLQESEKMNSLKEVSDTSSIDPTVSKKTITSEQVSLSVEKESTNSTDNNILSSNDPLTTVVECEDVNENLLPIEESLHLSPSNFFSVTAALISTSSKNSARREHADSVVEWMNCRLKIGFPDLFEVSQKPDFSRTRTLVLRNVGLTSLSSLSLRKEFPSLISLDVAGNGLSGTIGESELSHRLQRLDISHNNFHALTGVLSCVDLVALNVAHNVVRSLYGLPVKLQRLDLSYNRLSTLASIRSLAICPRISSISLAGNPLAVSQGANLRLQLRGLFRGLKEVDGVKLTASGDVSTSKSQPATSGPTMSVINGSMGSVTSTVNNNPAGGSIVKSRRAQEDEDRRRLEVAEKRRAAEAARAEAAKREEEAALKKYNRRLSAGAVDSLTNRLIRPLRADERPSEPGVSSMATNSNKAPNVKSVADIVNRGGVVNRGRSAVAPSTMSRSASLGPSASAGVVSASNSRQKRTTTTAATVASRQKETRDSSNFSPTILNAVGAKRGRQSVFTFDGITASPRMSPRTSSAIPSYASPRYSRASDIAARNGRSTTTSPRPVPRSSYSTVNQQAAVWMEAGCVRLGQLLSGFELVFSACSRGLCSEDLEELHAILTASSSDVPPSLQKALNGDVVFDPAERREEVLKLINQLDQAKTLLRQLQATVAVSYDAGSDLPAAVAVLLNSQKGQEVISNVLIPYGITTPDFKTALASNIVSSYPKEFESIVSTVESVPQSPLGIFQSPDYPLGTQSISPSCAVVDGGIAWSDTQTGMSAEEDCDFTYRIVECISAGSELAIDVPPAQEWAAPRISLADAIAVTTPVDVPPVHSALPTEPISIPYISTTKSVYTEEASSTSRVLFAPPVQQLNVESVTPQMTQSEFPTESKEDIIHRPLGVLAATLASSPTTAHIITRPTEAASSDCAPSTILFNQEIENLDSVSAEPVCEKLPSPDISPVSSAVSSPVPSPMKPYISSTLSSPISPIQHDIQSPAVKASPLEIHRPGRLLIDSSDAESDDNSITITGPVASGTATLEDTSVLSGYSSAFLSLRQRIASSRSPRVDDSDISPRNTDNSAIDNSSKLVSLSESDTLGTSYVASSDEEVDVAETPVDSKWSNEVTESDDANRGSVHGISKTVTKDLLSDSSDSESEEDTPTTKSVFQHPPASSNETSMDGLSARDRLRAKLDAMRARQ